MEKNTIKNSTVSSILNSPRESKGIFTFKCSYVDCVVLNVSYILQQDEEIQPGFQYTNFECPECENPMTFLKFEKIEDLRCYC